MPEGLKLDQIGEAIEMLGRVALNLPEGELREAAQQRAQAAVDQSARLANELQAVLAELYTLRKMRAHVHWISRDVFGDEVEPDDAVVAATGDEVPS